MVKTKKSLKSTNEKTPQNIKRLRSKPIIAERKQRLRKCKKVIPRPPLNICDLPTEILEKIIGNVNIWHHNRIRSTSKRMKEVNDIFVMHEFQKASKKAMAEDPNSEASAALRVCYTEFWC